jgi:hypothetical protein
LSVTVDMVEPKLVPVIVTAVPTGPEIGERPVMLGVGMTLNAALADTPPTVTATLPLPAGAAPGTVIVMLVVLQFVADAATLFTVTVLSHCFVPKLLPVIVMDAPAAPEGAERLDMDGEA